MGRMLSKADLDNIRIVMGSLKTVQRSCHEVDFKNSVPNHIPCGIPHLFTICISQALLLPPRVKTRRLHWMSMDISSFPHMIPRILRTTHLHASTGSQQSLLLLSQMPLSLLQHRQARLMASVKISMCQRKQQVSSLRSSFWAMLPVLCSGHHWPVNTKLDNL